MIVIFRKPLGPNPAIVPYRELAFIHQDTRAPMGTTTTVPSLRSAMGLSVSNHSPRNLAVINSMSVRILTPARPGPMELRSPQGRLSYSTAMAVSHPADSKYV